MHLVHAYLNEVMSQELVSTWLSVDKDDAEILCP
jgi:hypothetical protein